MERFSPYEYLAYLLPGGVLMATAIGIAGWPATEPGVSSFAFLVALSFIVGHGVASIASWVEPLFWGRMPGTSPDPLWGLFGEGRPYREDERTAIEASLQTKLGSQEPLPSLYRLARVRLQQMRLDAHLQVLNQQIGFYRNMTASLLSGLALQVVSTLAGTSRLPTYPWLALFFAGAILFTYRYRRFWTYFGAATIRGILVLSASDLPNRHQQET